MTSKLYENIKALRKKQHITQEQLAEAVGVSVGAVYKWEQNLSSPDIHTIMELASFFGVSLDALVGYEMQDPTADAYADRIFRLQQQKEYSAAAVEAEKALVLYPNHFQLVYRCGILYQMMGLENIGPHPIHNIDKAIELFERAKLLLSQNRDSEVNLFTIRTAVATCLLIQGKKEQALKELKGSNMGGVHDSQIGLIYACSEEYPAQKAGPYLTDAFQNAASSLLQTMLGYINYYERTSNPTQELDAVLWLIHYLESLRPDEGVSFMDKYLGPVYSEYARLLELLGKPSEAEAALRKAFSIASAFDRSPSCCRSDLRFFLATNKETTIYDDAGPTSISAIEEQMEREHWSDFMRSAWERIKEEV